MSYPRVVASGECWRVVLVELADEHGVLRVTGVVETTDKSDRDALGVQRWTRLTDKSAQGDWRRVVSWLLNEIIKEKAHAEDI